MSIRSQVRDIFHGDVIDRGRNIYVNCPFCHTRGKSPDDGYHLGISTMSHKQVVGCFRCGYHNSWPRMLKHLGIDPTIVDEDRPDYIQVVNEYVYGTPKVATDVVSDLMEEYMLTRCADDPQSNIAQRCYRYLRGRGLSDETIRWVDPCFSSHPDYLNRVIIPFYDEDGLIEYFVGRDLGHGPKKTNNPKVDKGGLMYNWKSAKRFNRVIITEGVFDALSVGRDAVALLGSVITKPQIEEFRRAMVPEIVVLLDADAMDKAFDLFYTLSMWTSSRVGMCPMVEGDPNDKENRDRMRDILDEGTLWGWDVTKLRVSRC